MTERLKQIFSSVPAGETFADIGCDHGYIAKEMLFKGKCKKAIVSDISEKSLEKARNLLKTEILNGRAEAVVSDGFINVPFCDVALIAGLGGDEIIKILSDAPFLPERLTLQPMKKSPKVREFVVSIGYFIEEDRVFLEGHIFYDVIRLIKGKDSLSPEEIEFGRTNLVFPSDAFKKKIAWEIKSIDERIKAGGLKPHVLAAFIKKREELKKYV